MTERQFKVGDIVRAIRPHEVHRGRDILYEVIFADTNSYGPWIRIIPLEDRNTLYPPAYYEVSFYKVEMLNPMTEAAQEYEEAMAAQEIMNNVV